MTVDENNSDGKTNLIGQRRQIMIINILKNYNYRNFSHYIIIKYIDFEQIPYVINLNIASSSKVFSKLDFIFLSNILLISINKLFIF